MKAQILTLDELAGMCEVLVMSNNCRSYFLQEAESEDGGRCLDLNDDMGDSHTTQLDPESKVEINAEGLVCVGSTWFRPYLYQKINLENYLKN